MLDQYFVFIIYRMTKNNKFTTLASSLTVEKTKGALITHGITVKVAENADEVRKLIHSLIPTGSEVMTASSMTLETLGITKEINESGKYKSVKEELSKLNRDTDGIAMQKLGAAPEYIIGSVHAVTEDGRVMIASNTGSQIPGYVYGSSHVVWVVSTKKIVKNLDEAIQRINEYVLPQEDKRLKSVYGPQAESQVRKLLIVNSEINPNRITLLFIKEDLGF